MESQLVKLKFCKMDRNGQLVKLRSHEAKVLCYSKRFDVFSIIIYFQTFVILDGYVWMAYP